MQPTNDPVVILNAQIFDGTTNAPIPRGAIVTRADRIESIRPAAAVDVPAEATIIDAEGHTVLPGFIDCHTHLANDGSPAFYEQCVTDTIATASLRGAQNCRRQLDHGVTTVRDCGASHNIAIDLATAVSTGLIPGPRILAGGRPITMTGGHCHFMGGEADGVDGVRAAVRAELKQGVDFVKVMATGGIQTPVIRPRQIALTLPELQTAVEEARHAGKRTACHAISAEGVKNAIRAGMDSIEHWYYIDDEGLELGLASEAYFVPTMTAVDRIVEHQNDAQIPQWVIEQTVEAWHRNQASVTSAVDAGLKIALGTDAGTPFNPHGALAEEIILLARYGASAADAIRAGTANGAANLGILEETGTLEPGKRADITVVADDPLSRIEAVREVRAVIAAGRLWRCDLPVRAQSPKTG